MANLQMVFSDPGDQVSDETFDRWYDEHLAEILSIPGFLSAQRYALSPAVELEGVPAFRRVVVYEVDDDTDRLMRSMRDMRLDRHDSYEELKEIGDDDGPELPTWWGDVRFASWNCIPIGERVSVEGTR